MQETCERIIEYESSRHGKEKNIILKFALFYYLGFMVFDW